MTDQADSNDPGTAGIGDARRFAPSAQRNRQPILDVLARVLPESGLVLDLASGSGEHALHFARNLPTLRWQPSDPDPASRLSIDAHAAAATAEPCPNLLPALDVDVTAADWPVRAADAIVCINMVHISPWSASEGLFAGAGRILSAAGVLYLYGPYKRNGRHTAPSNEAFDASLHQRNSAWGVRDLEDLVGLGVHAGLALREVVDMPANNLSLVFVKT